MRLTPILAASIALVGTAPAPAPAQEGQSAAVQRGVQYLRGVAGTQETGESALAALALSKAELPASDPAVAAAVARVRRRFNGSTYQPERSGGSDVYEAGVICLAFANVDPVGLKAEIEAAARYLMSAQKAKGCWDYSGRESGDTSISQYAVLGLWEAENAGVDIPPRVWDRAAGWFIGSQEPAGNWVYHPGEADKPSISMAAAGVGSLLICQRQLARHRQAMETGVSKLLTPVGLERKAEKFTAANSVASLNAAIRRGLTWIAANFNTGSAEILGKTPFYGLYGIERIGGLASKDDLGGVDWFAKGSAYIEAKQAAGGSWNAEFGTTPNTAWAMLFLVKSTAKSVKKYDVKRLGAGTLLGGRGLPSDLSSLTIAQGRVVVRPMNGAIEGMLDVLADPRADQADAALAGLVDRYKVEGPKALRPHKERFRKLLADRDPGVRKVAAWALGRTADLDAVPALIAALKDPDGPVSLEAQTGLQVISRKLDGLGPPPGATAEQKADAARKWRAWYDSARPPSTEGSIDALLGRSGP